MFPQNTEYWENVSQSWQKAFQVAYPESKYGDKDLSRFIANPLHVLFRASIREWLDDETWNIDDVDGKPIRATRLAIFNKNSRIRRNQPDPRAALWVARRWHRYFSAAQGLRSRLMDRAPSMTLVDLRREINKVLPHGSFLSTLRHICGDQNADPREFFNMAWLSARLLVEAMLEAELKKKHYDPKKVSVKTYVKVGKELLSLMSYVPKPHF